MQIVKSFQDPKISILDLESSEAWISSSIIFYYKVSVFERLEQYLFSLN